MRLDISDIVKLNGASLDVKFNEYVPGLQDVVEDFTLNGPVNFEGKLHNVSGVLKLTGHLNVSYSAKCFRCLQDLNKDLHADISEDIIDARNDTDGENYAYEGNVFEIDKVIKDNIVLNLPVRLVCNVECKGLCPKCGCNLNAEDCKCEHDTINPQMEALRDFFKN